MDGYIDLNLVFGVQFGVLIRHFSRGFCWVFEIIMGCSCMQSMYHLKGRYEVL